MQGLWMEVLVLGPAFRPPPCQSLPQGSGKAPLLLGDLHSSIKPQNIQLLVPTEEKEHPPFAVIYVLLYRHMECSPTTAPC